MEDIVGLLEELSDELMDDGSPVSIVLAAGHGKRIKSEKPKMLHEIWGVPTVIRVSEAARKGLNSGNQIIVVGMKADQVAMTVGKKRNLVYAYQAKQRGTGDAVKVALEILQSLRNIEDVYIFPGDMGLITSDVVSDFRESFEKSGADMMILTGYFKGNPENNMYGRIVRIPERDISGKITREYCGQVLAIKEQKDILAMRDDEMCEMSYNGMKFRFSKEFLLNLKEFNTGVYAIKYKFLKEAIEEISPDNVQGEYYLTDLISIFNRKGLKVNAEHAKDDSTIIGFNVKSVLKEMENIYREKVWQRLCDIIVIEDRYDFYIADEVVNEIIEMDKNFGPLDIYIGKGVYISKGVKLNKGVALKSGAYLNGNIEIGEGTVIEENVSISTYPHQTLKIGKNCVIMRGDIIKGNLVIGNNSRIESGVNITGSDEFPVRIGNNVIIKGTSYIFGSIIEDDLFIEHSVLKCKLVERTVRKDGSIQPVRWVMPQPQGLDVIKDIEKNSA